MPHLCAWDQGPTRRNEHALACYPTPRYALFGPYLVRPERSVPAYLHKGIELTELGRAREAVAAHQIALRLSPKDPLAPNMHYSLCHAHLHIREYAEAIDECRRAINLNETLWYAYVDLVVAYGATGQPEQSRRALADLYRVRPDFTIEGFQQLAFSFSPNAQFRKEFTEILIDGLRKTGAKEQ
jgi:adenylate cyclase